MTNREENKNSIYEVSLLDLLVILAEQRRFIAKVTIIFAVLSIIYALVATPTYKSTIQIMPPSSASSGAVSALAASGLGGMLGISMTSTSDTVAGVMQSPTVLDRVIDANSLMTREPEGFSLTRPIINAIKSLLPKGEEEEEGKRTRVREELFKHVSVVANKMSGIISVSVWDTSQDMAVSLAQSIYDETLAVMQYVAVTPSSQKRLFLEEQIKTIAEELTVAEHNLVAFQKKTGMVSAGDTPSDVTALANLQARMLSKEIELRAARRFATEKNPQIKKLEAELAAIKRQFQADSAKAGTVPLSGVGLSKLPETSLEYASLYREYKFRENLYELMLSQYETAKINELNDPLVIQSLGAPVYPELKDKPRRKVIVILATALGLFIGIFGAFVRHFILISSADPTNAPKMKFVLDAILHDPFGIRKQYNR